MQSQRTLAAVIGVLVVAGLALAIVATQGGAPDELVAQVSGSEAPTPTRAERAGPQGALAAEMPREGELRNPVVATPAPNAAPSAFEPERGAASESRSAARIVGRTVDEFGNAVPGVELRAGSALATSAEDGAFALRVDPGSAQGQSFRLQLARAGFGNASLEVTVRAGETSDVGDLVMEAVGLVTGRVIGVDGAPIGGVDVALEEGLGIAQGSRFTGPENPLGRGRSEPDGRFALEAPARGVRVWAGGGELAWSTSERIEVPPGGEISGMELVLVPFEREDTIEVVVLDPHGAPVPRAIVRYSYDAGNQSGTGETNADEHGRLRLFVLARAGHDFMAFDPAQRFRPAFARRVPPGARDVELRLAEHAALRVRARDSKGAPVEAFDVELRSAEQGFRDVSTTAEGPHRAGIAVLVLPVVAFSAIVDAEGFELRELGPFDPALVPDPIEAELVPLPAIRGRVTAHGEPLSGAVVSLHEAIDSTERYVVNGFPCRSQRYGAADATTDDEGRFALTLRSPGRWFLRARAPGFAPNDAGPFELDPRRGAGELAIDLARGGALEGRVLLYPGEELSGWIVGISRGDGYGFTARTDANGEFAFAGLTAGRWLVEWREEEIRTGSVTSGRSTGFDGQEYELPWSCEVQDERTTTFDLDLRALRDVSVAGRLLLGGQPLPNALAKLDQDGTLRSSTSIDARGEFVLATSRAGEFELAIDASLANGAALRLRAPLALGGGATTWQHELPSGRIAGRALPDALEPNSTVDFDWSGPEGIAISVSVPPRADGTFEVPLFPAGAAQVSYRLRDGTSGSHPVTVAPGASATVSIP